MKKLMIGAVLLAVSGVAAANEYTADGFRITQVGTGTAVNVTPIDKGGFNTLERCTSWLQEQINLAVNFSSPAGQSAKSEVHAVCTVKKLSVKP